jgi:branched-chain amino acid transport system substrate-binding protein
VDIRITRLVKTALAVCGLSVAIAACGSRGSSSPQSSSGSSASTAAAGPVSSASCPSGQATQGVTSKTVTLATSLPESGPLAAVVAEAQGEQAAFNVTNAQGGVHGKKLVLVSKDDAYTPAKTVANVTSFLQSGNVFAMMGIVGTAGNLAVAKVFDQQCVPNLAAITGAPVVAQHAWTAIAQQSEPTEVAVTYDHLKKVVPNAKVGLVYQNDDLGQTYLSAWKKAVAGGGATLVDAEPFEITDQTVTNQVTKVASKGANVMYFASGGGATCAAAMSAAAGKFKEVVLSGNCAVKPLLALASPAAQQNVYTVVTYEDPQDPANANTPKVKAYLAAMKKIPGANPNSAQTEQGYTIGTVVSAILNRAPSLTRADVINTAKTIDLNSPGMLAPGIPWKVSASDPYPVESYYFAKWDPVKKLFVYQGALDSAHEGQTAQLTG